MEVIAPGLGVEVGIQRTRILRVRTHLWEISSELGFLFLGIHSTWTVSYNTSPVIHVAESKNKEQHQLFAPNSEPKDLPLMFSRTIYILSRPTTTLSLKTPSNIKALGSLHLYEKLDVTTIRVAYSAFHQDKTRSHPYHHQQSSATFPS